MGRPKSTKARQTIKTKYEPPKHKEPKYKNPEKKFEDMLRIFNVRELAKMNNYNPWYMDYIKNFLITQTNSFFFWEYLGDDADAVRKMIKEFNG